MTDKPKLSTGQVVAWNEEKGTSFYSNLMGIAMTPFDIGIIFGQIGQATSTNVEGLMQAKILLSPEQVKNLIKLLSIALEKYVSVNGALRLGGDLNEDVFVKELEENRVEPK